jgi:hypothetical protein
MERNILTHLLSEIAELQLGDVLLPRNIFHETYERFRYDHVVTEKPQPKVQEPFQVASRWGVFQQYRWGFTIRHGIRQYKRVIQILHVLGASKDLNTVVRSGGERNIV